MGDSEDKTEAESAVPTSTTKSAASSKGGKVSRILIPVPTQPN